MRIKFPVDLAFVSRIVRVQRNYISSRAPDDLNITLPLNAIGSMRGVKAKEQGRVKRIKLAASSDSMSTRMPNGIDLG